MPWGLQQHTLCHLGTLFVSELSMSYLNSTNLTNFQIVARNLIVNHLARVIVESTIVKMVVRLAKYHIQARSVPVKS